MIYRPEPSVSNPYTMSEFFEEFTELLLSLQMTKCEFLIAGDFNFHMNKVSETYTKRMAEILELFDLKQHVVGPTHTSGNTLDLIITPHDLHVSNVRIDELNSDHHCILFQVNIQKPPKQIKQIRFRKTKQIDLETLKADLRRHLTPDPEQTGDSMMSESRLTKLLDRFNSTCEVLDKHAPFITRSAPDRKPTPWSSYQIKSAKVEKRRAERKWRRTRSQDDLNHYKEKRNDLNKLLDSLKSNHLSGKIRESKGNSKAMFKIINSCLHRKQQSPMPDHSDADMLANEFNTYFRNKILDIRTKLDSTNHDSPGDKFHESVFNGMPLNKFSALPKEEIRKIVTEMSTKHCELDPLPTWLLKQCLNEFLPLITEIVNLSLQLGIMPNKLKHAVIKPLLKKPGLDLVKKNYRPVSNLTFLSKIIEGAVIKQFTEHLSVNRLHDPKQSAYRKFHSTETLLTKIHNDIINNMGKGNVNMLVLLDLSAAFDTIDHSILIKRLRNMYGITGSALEWFRSYLRDRSQSVVIENHMSRAHPLKYGVPQGSKLGPILFNAYIAPVSSIAGDHNVTDEKYADDEQLILSFKPNSEEDQRNAINNMEKCIDDIREFLHRNKMGTKQNS